MCKIEEVAEEFGCPMTRLEQERNIAAHIMGCKKKTDKTGLSVCSHTDWQRENEEMANIDAYWLNEKATSQVA